MKNTCLFLAGSLMAATASAQDSTLDILRDATTGLSQKVELAAWSYDATAQVLHATSRDGSLTCAQAAVPGWDGAFLELDGRYYALESLIVPGKADTELWVQPVTEFMFGECRPTSKEQRQIMAKAAGPLNLSLPVVANDVATTRSYGLTDRVSFSKAARPTFAAALDAAVTGNDLYCLDTSDLLSTAELNASADLLLTDANGVTQTLVGVTQASFTGVSNTVSFSSGLGFQCFAVSETAEAAVPAADYTVCDAVAGDPDTIFSGHFEIEPADFRLKLVIDTYPTATTPAEYRIAVQNCDGSPLTDVRVATYVDNFDTAAQIDGATADGYVATQIATIPANNAGEIAVSRSLASGATEGEVSAVAAIVIDGTTLQQVTGTWTIPVQ